MDADTVDRKKKPREVMPKIHDAPYKKFRQLLHKANYKACTIPVYPYFSGNELNDRIELHTIRRPMSDPLSFTELTRNIQPFDRSL